jgi:acetate CoA/acetoacetate CoA-transferase alpha subunit
VFVLDWRFFRSRTIDALIQFASRSADTTTLLQVGDDFARTATDIASQQVRAVAALNGRSQERPARRYRRANCLVAQGIGGLESGARHERRRPMRTILVEEAVALIPDGASLMIGGFMGVGTPDMVIDELLRQQRRDLTVIANDTAMPGRGIGKLVSAKALRKVIASHIGLNPETQQQMIAGTLQVELIPQGTLIEQIRAGGHGLGGVLTPTGVGTVVEEGKRKIEVDGREFLLELPLKADFAIVQAFMADYYGNLVYALTARNFNPVMAMAGGTVIAEVEQIVPVGMISPDHVVTPAVLVDYLVRRA